MTKQATEKARKAALERWSATPSENPRYRGATPADVARALLGKACHTAGKVVAGKPPVKTDV